MNVTRNCLKNFSSNKMLYWHLICICRWWHIYLFLAFKWTLLSSTYHMYAKASINCPCWRSGASCLNSGLHLYLVYAGNKGPGESTHLHRLTWAFISWTCDKYQNQMCWFIWFILCDSSYNLFSLIRIMQMIGRMLFCNHDHIFIWNAKYE